MICILNCCKVIFGEHKHEQEQEQGQHLCEPEPSASAVDQWFYSLLIRLLQVLSATPWDPRRLPQTLLFLF
jgi:hypothetical protein